MQLARIQRTPSLASGGTATGARFNGVATRRARAVAARAENDGGQGGGRPVDWDGAWSSFQRQMQSQVEMKDTTTTSSSSSSSPFNGSGRVETPRRAAPRRVTRLPSSGAGANSWNGQEGERIRRAERVLLDIWNSEDFLKAGATASIILLVVFVLVVGPPPPDGRCSLYWC